MDLDFLMLVDGAQYIQLSSSCIFKLKVLRNFNQGFYLCRVAIRQLLDRADRGFAVWRGPGARYHCCL